jgi:Overcoming lysogenization defect protein-like, TOPRIM domain
VIVLVEGESDRVALEALAGRRGIALADHGVEVVALGGAHRIGAFLGQLDPASRPRVAGLCDAREEQVFRKAFESAGFGSGVFVCVDDLEDELIRALGAAAVEEIVRANGDLRRLRALQQMPQWRDAATENQLRRFIGSGAGRKIRYARLLVEGLDHDSVPRPLDRVLEHAVNQ